MPEFPSQFTVAPSVTGTDYVLLEQYKATVDQLAAYIAPGGGQTLVEWNGTSTAQFTTTGDIGTPTAPAISFLATGTYAADNLRLTLGNGTGANEGRAYFFSDTATFQSMRVTFTVSLDAANTIQPGETLGVGVVFGASQTTGNSVSCVLFVDDAGQPTVDISESDAYNTPAANVVNATITTAGTGAWIVDMTFTGRLTDSGTYTPNGAPALSGELNVVGIGGDTGYHAMFSAPTTNWDPSVGALDKNRVGVVVLTTTGVTATTGLLLSGVTFRNA